MSNCANCDNCPFVVGPDYPTQDDFHEIHITVETADIPHFKKVCEMIGVTPVLIEFQTELRDKVTHVMSTYRQFSTDAAAKEAAAAMAEAFDAEGLKVIRTKIETTINGKRRWDFGYFESHLAFKVQAHQISSLSRVLWIVEPTARLSRNAFKRDGDVLTVMATKRNYRSNPEDFKARMLEIKEGMAGYGFVSDKLIIEFCWYDSNVTIDSGWL